jgi:hypothetical protein
MVENESLERGLFDVDQDRTKPTLPVAKSRSRYVDLFL